MAHTTIKATDLEGGVLEIIDNDGKTLMLLTLFDDGYFSLDMHRESKHIGFDLREHEGQECIAGRKRVYTDDGPENDFKTVGVIENMNAAEGVSWKSRKAKRGE